LRKCKCGGIDLYGSENKSVSKGYNNIPEKPKNLLQLRGFKLCAIGIQP
jgi:hypothetical protein